MMGFFMIDHYSIINNNFLNQIFSNLVSFYNTNLKCFPLIIYFLGKILFNLPKMGPTLILFFNHHLN
jgi:hypothetical protein